MYSPADWSSIYVQVSHFLSVHSLHFNHPSLFIPPVSDWVLHICRQTPNAHEVTIQNTIASCFWATLLGKAATGFRNVDWMSIKRKIVMNWFCLVLRKEGSVCFMCHLSAYANLLTLHWLLHIENLIEMMVRQSFFFISSMAITKGHDPWPFVRGPIRDSRLSFNIVDNWVGHTQKQNTFTSFSKVLCTLF